MKVVILNDTAVSSHFGCHMVMSAIRQLCREYEIEIVGTQKLGEPWHARPQREMLSKADLVIVNSEGSVHHDRYIDLIRVSDEYPSILINGVFQAMSPQYCKHLDKFKFVSVRESFSKAHMATHGVTPEVIPDLIFTHFGTLPVIADKVQGTFMSDSVVGTSLYTKHAKDLGFVQTMATYPRACCGRFHAIAVAAMLGIPFTAWKSNTWKNEAMMSDMGVPHLYEEEQRVAIDIIPDSLDPCVTEYVANAFVRIHRLFKDIANATYQ